VDILRQSVAARADDETLYSFPWLYSPCSIGQVSVNRIGNNQLYSYKYKRSQYSKECLRTL
jgi:hypothetical protein